MCDQPHRESNKLVWLYICIRNDSAKTSKIYIIIRCLYDITIILSLFSDKKTHIHKILSIQFK